jgi:hypothetical protein
MDILREDSRPSRRQFLGASACVLATATTTTATVAGERPKPTRRRAEPGDFWIAARDGGWDGDESGRAATIEGVIASHIETYRDCEADSVKHGESAAEHRARIEDIAIWEGSRLVAALQVMPDGRIKVTRLD